MDVKVLEAILQLEPGDKVALATIIATKGSTPRKAGAQILFFRDGRSVGTVGGGCGEADVQRHAFNVLDTETAKIIDINLTHEIAEADGMVCGGTMDVFIEPLSTGEKL